MAHFASTMLKDRSEEICVDLAEEVESAKLTINIIKDMNHVWQNNKGDFKNQTAKYSVGHTNILQCVQS